MNVHDIDMSGVVAGQHRLTPAEALTLYQQASTHDLGRWAFAVAQRKLTEVYPQQQGRVRTYVIDRNINYTNVCSASCTFCAFKRDLGETGSYTLTQRELLDKVRELVAIGGTQILLQGGMHPDLPISFYEDMLQGLKAEFPQVHIHGFSPPEIVEFIAIFKLEGFPTTAPSHSHEIPWDIWVAKGEAILNRLRQAGLDSIPGGGGEIFAPHVRRRIGLGKATATQWLEVMSMAHRLGMCTSATMMFGHIEGLADRIDHLEQVRAAQDRALTLGWPGRYVSFIAWPFQRENTPLGRVKEWDRDAAAVSGELFPGDQLAQWVFEDKVDGGDKAACDAAVPMAGKRLRSAGAVEYLRTQALARLYLDNVLSIGASWVTMGPKIGQMGLYFGAGDMGSVMMEENVVSAAGTTYCLDEPVLCQLIRSAGFVPAQRDNRYQLLKVHEDASSPDLQVKDWSKHRTKRLHQEKHDSSSATPADTSGMVTLTISENPA